MLRDGGRAGSDDGPDRRLDVWWVVTLAGVLLVVLSVGLAHQALAVRRASKATPAAPAPVDTGEPGPVDTAAVDTAATAGAAAPVEPAAEGPAVVGPATAEPGPGPADAPPQNLPEPPSEAPERAAGAPAAIIEPRRAPLE